MNLWTIQTLTITMATTNCNGIHTWTSKGVEHTIYASIGYEIFIGLHIATLLGGEFSNTYGQGSTPEDAMLSLKLRVIQLRNNGK